MKVVTSASMTQRANLHVNMVEHCLTGSGKREEIMRNLKLGVVVTSLVLTAGSAAFGYTRTDVSDLATVTAGMQVLDLSSLGLNNGDTIAFTGSAYTGSITATVYGNSPIFTPGLTDVLVVYTFEGNGQPTPIEEMEFAVAGGNLDLNFAELDGGVMGRIDDMSDINLDSDPLLTFNPGPANDSMLFDWTTEGLGDPFVSQSYTWYTRTSGAIDIGMVNVEVRNSGSVITQTIAVLDDPSQPDLDVPAPGSLALMGLGAFIIGRRRH